MTHAFRSLMHGLTFPQVLRDPPANLSVGVRAEELSAISQVYREHQVALCSFASRLLADRQAAEDLVHDVFVSLPKIIHKFQAGKSMRGFLLSLAANRARHYLRAARRRRRLAERFAREPSPSEVEQPERRLDRSELAAAVARALDQLSLPQRLAFVLCEIEKVGSREAAEILGVPEGTVRTRLFHAKRRIRVCLAAEGLP